MDFKLLFKGVLVSIEKGLLKLVDENMSKLGKDFLKDQSAKLIDSNYDKLLGGLHGKVRGLIDKIDGEANLPPMPGDVPAGTTSDSAPPSGVNAEPAVAPKASAPQSSSTLS